MTSPSQELGGSLRTSRARRPFHLLFVVLAALAVTVPPPAGAVIDPVEVGSTGDYQQVVHITFPFTPDVPVRYRDDYDAPRTSSRYHQATDLMVAGGTPVHAAMGGTVAWMSGDRLLGPPSYGWMVRIAGDDGRTYAYVHLGWQDRPWEDAYAPGIERGVHVERGDLLGWAGCSGSATCGGGEHLHFEIHDASISDPYDYHDHERINPYWSLVEAEERGDHPYAGLFGDVAAGSVHEQDIEALAESGITRGCGNDSFCPQDEVTRQQMASFLTRALDLPAPAKGRDFTDVTRDNVHRADIAALATAGITMGCGPGEFCPSQAVTRQQMASFLVRALELAPAPSAVFTDVQADNSHAADIAALAAAGITRGCGDGQFCPDAPVTREQMASFLVRALDL